MCGSMGTYRPLRITDMRWLSKPPVFVFGAGATKACGGPLTAEILPDAFNTQFSKDLERRDLAAKLEDCLVRHFHVPSAVEARAQEDYPPLPLLLSLLDLAIDQDRPLVFKPRMENGDRRFMVP